MPYNPNQPRVPAGSSIGGEWTDDPVIIEARKAAGLPALPNSPDKVIKQGDFVFDGLKRGFYTGRDGELGKGIPAYLVDTGGGRIEPMVKDQVEKVKFSDDNITSLKGDQKRFFLASDKELNDIGKEWGRTMSISKLRAFQQNYVDLMKTHTGDDWVALNNRWKAVTAAIDYRAFTLNKG